MRFASEDVGLADPRDEPLVRLIGRRLVGRQQSQREPRIVDLGEQLLERAARMKGITGENLLFLLERRLDNAIYRAGFSTSRRQARQLVNHGHVLVNDRKVDIPSYPVKPGDSRTIKDASRKNPHVEGAWQTAAGRGRPSWVSAGGGDMAATVTGLPTRDDIDRSINERLKVGVSTAYITSKSNISPNGGFVFNLGVLTNLLFTSNAYNLYPDEVTGVYPAGFQFANPLDIIANWKAPQEIDRFIGGLQLTATPLEHLTVAYRLGLGVIRTTGWSTPATASPPGRICAKKVRNASCSASSAMSK